MATSSKQSKAALAKPKLNAAAKFSTSKKSVGGRPTVFRKDYIEVADHLTAMGSTLPKRCNSLRVRGEAIH